MILFIQQNNKIDVTYLVMWKPAEARGETIVQTLTNIVILLASTYILILVFLFFVQEKLIFPGFEPAHLNYQHRQSTTITLKVGEHKTTHLTGWRESAAATNSDQILLYFSGNAEDNIHVIPFLSSLQVSRIYTFHYRGYGLSEGNISESNLYSDSLEIFDLIQRDNPNATVIVMGRSLGSAIAGYVAKHREVSKLVLLTPLHSISKIVKESFIGLVPPFVLKHKLQLAETAKDISAPTLAVIAGKDTIIPNHHSMKSYQNLQSPKTLLTLTNAGHNDLFEFPELAEKINTFIDQGINDQ